MEAMTNNILMLRKINLTCIVGVLVVLLFEYSVAIAQDRQSNQNLHPGIPYTISDIENINLTNGNLMLNFSFGEVRGRGTATAGISLKYNSKRYESHVMTTLDLQGNPAAQSFIRADNEGGWKYDGDYELRVINKNSFVDNPPQAGGGCDPPNFDSVFVWKLILYFPDGSQHEFRPTGYSDNLYNNNGYSIYDGDGYFNVNPSGLRTDLIWSSLPSESCPRGVAYAVQVVSSQDPRPNMIYYSTDGTFMRLEIPSGQGVNPSRWTLYMPDGSKVTNGAQDSDGNPIPQRVFDRNGNFVTKAVITLPDGSTADGYVDELGRYIVRKIVSPMEDHIIKLGRSGEPIIWKIRWKYITVIKRYTTSGTSSGLGRCCYSDQVLTAQPKVVDEIEMPSQLGGLRYKFQYDGHIGQVDWNQSISNPNSSPGWGDLRSVTLPSGATVEYDYATDHNVPWRFTDQWLPQLGKIKKKVLIFETDRDGVSQIDTETWLYSISQSGTSVITNPDGAVHRLYFYSTDTDSDLSGRVYKEVSANGIVTERVWANNKVGGCPQFGCGSMRRLNTYVKTEFVTLPDITGNPALTYIKDFEFDKNGNPVATIEYDWVPHSSIIRDPLGKPMRPNGITPSRVTVNTYYSQTEIASDSASNNPSSYWNSTAPRVLNALQSSEIRNSLDNPVSRAEFEYDDPLSSANRIKTKTWASEKNGQPRAYSNPLNLTNSISVLASYDQYGNVTSTTDANGNITKITYGAVQGPNGAVHGLYPTQTVVAFGTSLARTTASTYDFYTGLLLTQTDVDNGVTNAVEYDALGRPVKSISAQGTPLESWTRTEYDDINRRVVVRSDLEAKGDGRKVSVQHFDQLGRVRLSRTLEDPFTQDAYNEADGIKVQTLYRTVSGYTYQLTSNPYRAATSAAAANEPTMGWTLSTAWADGRRSEVETFSGAGLPPAFGGNNTNSTGIVRTDIDANATTVTDQAGKKRRSITNALGQLVRADEPDDSGNLGSVSAPVQPTYYTYDALNNLTQVVQGVQTRTFVYDSLSRLVSASNPESGTITYQYDSNGNLTRKVDARGVQTDYVYDALNRVVQRNYSTPNGTPGVGALANYQPTPNVSYFYDGVNVAGGIPHSKGKLTKVSSSVSTTEYTSFDILGRVTGHKQTTDGQAYATAYVYNLSGALVGQTYPSGRKVKNTLDADGNLAQVHSQKSSTDVWRPYASNFVYTAAGTVSSMKLGNGRFENTAFNSRLQPTQIGLGSSATNQGLLKLNYDYGTTNNNGNVLSQTITVPTVGSNNGFVAVQTYSYDSLNRLKQATENVTPNGGSQSLSWQQTYTFDRYGNRNFDEANTTTLPKECNGNTEVCAGVRPIVNPSVNAANNRLNGYTFDAAGNMTADPQGRTFIYDAENKQTEVRDQYNTVIGQYAYDGDGKRVKKVIPDTGETTIFVYDASNRLVAEYSTIVEPATTAKTSYLTTDHLGSPRVLTDQLGHVISRRDFHPFGEEIATAERTAALGYQPDALRQKFTGYERDDETDLDFAQARYFRSGFGRFSSPDPENYGASIFEPQSWNGYAYVVNNPTNYVDPDGLEYVICPMDGGRCYTHPDDLVAKAKKEGEYNWVGSRNPKNGLDSGTIQDADGNVVATYQQISHDSPIQQMLWGAQPTLQIWKPIVDDVMTAMVSFGGAPVTSAVTAPTSIVRTTTTTATQAAMIAKSSRLAFNAAKGAIGEAQVLAKLAADGVEVVGTQVSAKLASGGRRVIDILVKVGDEVVAVEVKTGGARRSATQIAKDAEMLSNGATLVGKNAGDLSGKFYETIRTIVVQLP